jgi:thioredoxin 1
MAKDITDTEFKSLATSSKPVLVDFWAPWCGPCRQLAPVISELAEELKESVEIVKMNIDENQDTPSEFGVRSIPTLIIFKDGKQVATKVGSAPKSDLKQWIESNI